MDYRVILDIDNMFDKLIAESVIRQKYSPSEIFKNIVVVYIRGFCIHKADMLHFVRICLLNSMPD